MAAILVARPADNERARRPGLRLARHETPEHDVHGGANTRAIVIAAMPATSRLTPQRRANAALTPAITRPSFGG
jgi:hypothetical protein